MAENEYTNRRHEMQHVIQQAGSAYRNTVRVVDVEPDVYALALARVMPILKQRRREYADSQQEARVLVIDEIIDHLEARR